MKIINGAYNCVTGDNITIVNGKIISGNITSINGVPMEKSERSFECTADRKADVLVFTKNNNCSCINITADENVDRITAEVKATCYAPTKEQVDKVLENFVVKPVVKKLGKENIASFEEANPCSEATVSFMYNVKIPKTVKEILVKQTTANVIVSEFEGTLSLSVTTGNAVVSQCTLGNSKVKATTGNVRFTDNTVNKNVTVENTTGNISLSVNGGNGNVIAEVCTGTIRLLNESFDVIRTVRQSITGKQVFAEVNGCSITATADCGTIKY